MYASGIDVFIESNAQLHGLLGNASTNCSTIGVYMADARRDDSQFYFVCYDEEYDGGCCSPSSRRSFSICRRFSSSFIAFSRCAAFSAAARSARSLARALSYLASSQAFAHDRLQRKLLSAQVRMSSQSNHWRQSTHWYDLLLSLPIDFLHSAAKAARIFLSVAVGLLL